MSGLECPVLTSRDDIEILLSNYSTSVGTNVHIVCRKFAHHVTPSSVTCATDGSKFYWFPQPNFSCEYSLDKQEQLLLGVFIGTGLLFLVCIVCITVGAMYGDHRRRNPLRSPYGRDYFDNQKDYPLRESRRYTRSQDDLDEHLPRERNSIYGSQDNLDRYGERVRERIPRMFMDDMEYPYDRDYRLFRRYVDHNYPINPLLHSDNVRYRARKYRGNRENEALPSIWFTREIIDYLDSSDTYRPVRNDIKTDYRMPEEPIVDAPPRERPIIEAVPRRLLVPVEEPPERRILEFIEDPPPPAVVESTEKVILNIEHEPEYIETDFKDLGHYTMLNTFSPPVVPRRISDNLPLARSQAVEVLYAKPIKPKARVREIESHKGVPDYHDIPMIPEMFDARRSRRFGEEYAYIRGRRALDPRFENALQ